MSTSRRSRPLRARKARPSKPSPPPELTPTLVQDELAQIEAEWDALLVASTPAPR